MSAATPTTPDFSLYYPGTCPPMPNLPSLKNCNVGYSRNNTVASGERVAACQFMLSRLGGQIAKEPDGGTGQWWRAIHRRLERKWSTVGFCSRAIAGLVVIMHASGFVGVREWFLNFLNLGPVFLECLDLFGGGGPVSAGPGAALVVRTGHHGFVGHRESSVACPLSSASAGGLPRSAHRGAHAEVQGRIRIQVFPTLSSFRCHRICLWFCRHQYLRRSTRFPTFVRRPRHLSGLQACGVQQWTKPKNRRPQDQQRVPEPHCAAASSTPLLNGAPFHADWAGEGSVWVAWQRTCAPGAAVHRTFSSLHAPFPVPPQDRLSSFSPASPSSTLPNHPSPTHSPTGSRASSRSSPSLLLLQTANISVPNLAARSDSSSADFDSAEDYTGADAQAHGSAHASRKVGLGMYRAFSPAQPEGDVRGEAVEADGRADGGYGE